MPKWIKTNVEGVRYREHPTRKHGVRRDRYYSIRYRLNGRVLEQGVGWASKGVTLEDAVTRRKELTDNKKKGSGPLTIKEQRAENEAKREAETVKRKRDVEANKTLSEYWKESYFPAAQRSKKASSWCKEETHFRLWIGPLFGKLPLRSIGLKQWDELVKTLSAKGLSPRSKEYICGTLRRILKHAYDRRMVDDSPPSGKRIGVTGPGK